MKALVFLTLAVSPHTAFSDAGTDVEARKRSISIIEQRVEEREAEVVEIAREIVRLHRQLDGKLEKTVRRLAAISDSTRSGYRISKLKMDAIEALQKSISTFQAKRSAVLREMREHKTGIPKDVLEGDAEHFDEHIERHIEQMLEISKSFTQDENVEKYEAVGGAGYFGWDYGYVGISEEWKQNRRDRIMNKKQRSEVIGALKKSIQRCDYLMAGLAENLEKTELTAADRGLMESELQRHARMRELRESQLDELLLVDHPHTRELGRDAALEVEDAVRDQIADMQRTLDAIFLRHHQLNMERSKLFALKANLDARKRWLEKQEAEDER